MLSFKQGSHKQMENLEIHPKKLHVWKTIEFEKKPLNNLGILCSVFTKPPVARKLAVRHTKVKLCV